MIGNSLLAVACVMAATSLVGFGGALFGKHQWLSLARRAYWVFAIATAALSLWLLKQILDHNFTIQYVHSYSSTDLPLGFLISTFWAGQVGSFLFWLLSLAVLGLFLVHRHSEKQPVALFFYMLVNCFFLLLLVARSPFLPVVPQALLNIPDGMGLNPLLQNYWMVIHPPIVFIGFSLLAVPFVFALAALTRNDYSDWVENAFPWSALGASFLGAGIFLGGYWAYETLGWGGYWAWDPVENTSLIPWIVNLALLHGLLIERSRGVFRRSNLVMAIFGFVLVIYGTFLTRSGVLADFSVHSFTDLGTSGFLILFMVFFVVLGLALILIRLRAARSGLSINDPLSADFAIAIGVLFLLLLATLILTGTSAPLWTPLVFGEAGSVGPEVYNQVTLPLAVIVALLIGISPYLVAKQRSLPNISRRMAPALVLSLAAVVVAWLGGVSQILYLLVVGAGSLALFGNLIVIYHQPDKIGLRLGGFLTHMGFGVMLIGIVVSSAFTSTERVNLTAGSEPSTALGYQISYQGLEGDIRTKDNGVKLEIADGNGTYQARPHYFDIGRNQGIMRRPFIKKYLWLDLYLSPQEQQYVGDGDKLVLGKGEASRISDYEVKFLEFDMNAHDGDEGMAVGAVLEVSHDSVTTTVTPVMSFSTTGKTFQSAELPQGGTVVLNDIAADRGMVALQFAGVPGVEVLDLFILEVSTKPLINLVWLGVGLICVGTFLSFMRRRRLQKI